ncbi:MAG: hypothetical protein EXR45_04940 [Chloroflexi bacterium]|nr:hypothetical protein [Chloroflexota bacterium]
MFDIGVPELAVIAIVALVVLGPERLPEVMSQAGKLYRQVSTWRQQLMADVQEQIRAGMKEVEEVSANLNSAFQFGDSNSGSGPALPPPPLRQVPALRLQPDKSYDAGPFALAAWYRDTSPEAVLAPGPHSSRPRLNAYEPFALPQTTLDTLFGNAYVTSTASLVSPVHPFDDPYVIGSSIEERRPDPLPMIAAIQASAPRAEPPTPIDERAHHEATVISLFRLGAHTLESAARTLDLSASQFEKRVAELDSVVRTPA